MIGGRFFSMLWRIFLVIIIVLLMMAILLVSTQPGLNIIIYQLAKQTEGQWHINKAKGSLLGTLNLQGIKINENELNVAIDKLTIKWKPRYLLHKQLFLHQVIADNIQIHSRETASTTTETTNVSSSGFLKRITFENISLKQLQYQHNNGQTFNLRDFFISGNVMSGEDYLHLQINSLSGLWNEHALTGQGYLDWQSKQASQSDLVLRIGENEFNIKGSINNELDFAWEVNAPQLNTLLQGLIELKANDNHISASGRLTGTLTSPRLQATVQAKLSAPDWLIDNFQANVTWQNQEIALNATAAKIQYNDQTLSNAELSSQGTLEQLTISKATLTHSTLGVIMLTEPTQLALASENMKLLAPLCIQAAELASPICLTIDDVQQHWHLTFKATALPVEKIMALTQQHHPLTGAVNMNIDVTGQGLTLEKIAANATAAKLTYVVVGAEANALLNDVKLNIMLTDKLRADLTAQMNQQLTLNANLTLDTPSPIQISKLDLLEHPMQAKLQVNANNMDWLRPFIPMLAEGQGNFSGELNASGTLSNPKTNGQLSLNLGRYEFTDFGLQVKEVKSDINIIQNQLSVDGVVISDQGNLNITGNGQINQKFQLTTNLKLTGNNIRLINLEEYQITATPNLQFVYNEHGGLLTGDVKLPSVNIQPREIPVSESLSPDIVIDSKTTEATKSPSVEAPISLNIDVSTENAKLIYKAMTAEIQGKLNITQAPGKPMRANGRLTVNGTYQTRGQTLKIKNGRLNYVNDPLDSPRLDIKATKTVTGRIAMAPSTVRTSLIHSSFVQSALPSSFDVGIHIRGRPLKPQTQLYTSAGIMSDSDILSYLVLGQSASQAGQNQTQILLQAASSLNLTGSEVSSVTGGLQQTFGLDQIGFSSVTKQDEETGETTSEPAIGFGKFITPKLFIGYTVGLFDPINALQMQYHIRNNWVLQTQTGPLSSGADLIYSIEK